MNRRELFRQGAWLTGGTLLASTALALLQACGREDRRAWTPTYFTAEEAAFVTAYVDTLLPRTETPGGLDVNVDVFIDRVLAETSTPGDGPSALQKGIAEFEASAKTSHGRTFSELDSDQRGGLFADAEERSPRYNPQVWGTTVGEQPPIDFYRSFKSMVLWGYLSSEKIGTEVLNYDPVPGGYDGDISLESVGGRAWSLG